MSPSSDSRKFEVPPEITFVTLPKALAQFHHLPLHVPVWIHRQEEVKKKGYDFTEGARVMEELLKSAPEVPGAYLYQLFVKKWPRLTEVGPYFRAGRIAETIPKLVEVLEIDPECPLTCFQLGYCFRATGELEKSESFYLKALRMAPDAGWIYSNLGRTYLGLGDKVKAKEVFWKALELLPGDHFVLEQLIALGELFVVPGESKKGKLSALFIKREDFEKKMREAVEGERDPENLVQLGWRLLQDRLNELACLCLEKAMGFQKRPKEALLGLGIAHLEAGRASKAEHFLLEYLDQNPDSTTAHLNLFKAYLADGEMDLAWEEIQTAVRLEPNGLEGLKQIYYFFLQSGRKEEGLDWLDHLAGEHTALPGPLLVKAWALTEEKRWPEARQTLEEALKRSPHNEAILLTLTSEMGQRGEQEDLIHLLRGEPAPLPLTLTINLALAYSQTGRKLEGRKVLRAFLKRTGLTPLDKERVKALLQEFDKES